MLKNLLCVTLAVLVVALLTALPAVAKDSDVFAPNTAPFGRTYAQWSADWWRWALSIPPAAMPIVDPDGSSCAVGQHGPVWFLAGTFGATVVRNCEVPSDKALFFPLINNEWENAWVGQPVYTIDELRALVAPAGSPTNGLTLEVDGKAVLGPRDTLNLHNFRAISEVFDYSLPVDNFAGQPAGVYYPTVSDGYWVMLKPLPAGPHVVHFTGTIAEFGFSLDVTYNLDVIKLKGLCASPPCP